MYQMNLLNMLDEMSHKNWVMNLTIQKSCWVWCQWLTPLIWATQETEIRRIVVQSQSRQIVCKTLSQKHPTQKKGWWSGSRCRPSVQIPVLQKKKKSGWVQMPDCIRLHGVKKDRLKPVEFSLHFLKVYCL
jgi:hypothetical protein